MKEKTGTTPYFPFDIPIDSQLWHSFDLGATSKLIAQRNIPKIIFYRQLSMKLNNKQSESHKPVQAAQLNLFATLQNVYRYLIDVLAEEQESGVLVKALLRTGMQLDRPELRQTMSAFVEQFPPDKVLSGECQPQEWFSQPPSDRRQNVILRELLLLRIAAQNPAVDDFRQILDDQKLTKTSPDYPKQINALYSSLAKGPLLDQLDMTLFEALQAPIKASPDSLSGQIGYIQEHWKPLLPPELLEEVITAFDILLEEERERGWGGGEPGPPPVLEFGIGKGPGSSNAASNGSSVFGGYDYPEYESFSKDIDWMPNVVLMAKMVYVWLTQLSQQYGYPITRLDQLPDAELDRLANAGFTGLWLIGIWERSPASQRIKQLCGNPEAIASAYSLYDYEIAADLGGWEALTDLRKRALKRGIRLASDMVPNHTGIFSRWVIQHPDWFVQTDYPPFPTYQFNGENLSLSDDIVIQIEDGYWTKSDAAVVFRYIERQTGRIRYIYHGNDGTSIPWNDTAQLNYLLPEVRESVIQTILHVARNFPIIRFDAAMTLAKKHYERLWFPLRGLGGGIPSRAEHGMSREEFDAVFPEEFWRNVVDRVAAEAPDTLLLAEAFWMMEGYFVRTLGMHRVYNSAFMNMLKKEENEKYRKTISNVLEFNPEILKRFVNFMNNPDEKTAVEQFGTEGKYFGACVMMVTMPGLPMFGHGQLEGLREKYGMEYKRAYWDESVDQGLLRGHEMWIFPLLRRRWLFSGSENFALYNFYAGTTINENVFAYSNRVGGQRALILYNNSYSKTAGWIRESVEVATRLDNNTQELRRLTLTSALELNISDDVFYAFHDIIANRHFIRQSIEIEKHGLYAELGEYEFHVFLDFIEIRDDETKSWSRLCSSINGLGVEDLEVERLLCQYADLNAAFASALALIPMQKVNLLQDIVALKSGLDEEAINNFHSLLNLELQTVATDKPFKKTAAAIRFNILDQFINTKMTAKAAKKAHAELGMILESARDLKLLMAWSLLHGYPPDTLEQFGLSSTLLRSCKSVGDDKDTVSADAPVALLFALLSYSAHNAKKDTTPIERAFDLPACCDFMLVHDSAGTSWFNKERFELLLLWLYLIDLASDTSTVCSSTQFKSSVQEIVRLKEMAGHAGYRTKLFLSLAVPLAAGPKSKKIKVSNAECITRQTKSKTQND